MITGLADESVFTEIRVSWDRGHACALESLKALEHHDKNGQRHWPD